jgi:hypothetical protein
VTHDDWLAEHDLFLENVQHEDILDLYLSALFTALHEDRDEARQKLTTIVELAWAPSHAWTPREQEAARAVRLLFAHAGIKRQKGGRS